LLSYMSRPFVQWIVEHGQEHVFDNALLLLIVSILQHVKSDPTEAMRAISQIAAQPFTGDTTEQHLVEHPGGHLTLKRLILNDVQRIQQGELVLFSNILLDMLTEGSLQCWTRCNRGCFIVVSLLEVGNDEISQRVKKQLESVKTSLKSLNFKGAQILLSKL